MKEKIYDADKYIDFETIEILLKKNAEENYLFWRRDSSGYFCEEIVKKI